MTKALAGYRKSTVASGGLSNEPHSGGFSEGLLAQPFYGWVKWRHEFQRGLSASFSPPALASLAAATKARAREAR
jgi:hypothetical protein